MKTLLITGTNTEVGKTVLTSALAAYWLAYRDSCLGLLKLMQAGQGDREQYESLFGSQKSVILRVPLEFAAPVAPPIAAQKEGRSLDLKPVWQALRELQQAAPLVLVEGIGGLGCPVTAELTVADLARDWGLEAVLVVPVQLGAISQAVAHVALADHAQVRLKGIVLNCCSPEAAAYLQDWTPKSLIESLTGLPVLGYLPYLESCADLANLARIAADLDLEYLLPGLKN
ncbi:MAG: ATP-dependent dethiobiotin synthetase BioD [Chloroflexaceae bacterium]|nr:ATP-dependent dethiobiotin synthetase BioD [Chloroflexaceae bacterium]